MQKVLNPAMQNIWRGVMVLVTSMLLSLAAAAVNAQTAPSPLGIPLPAQKEAPASAPQSAPQTAGAITRMWNWLIATQSQLNRDLAAAVRGLKSDDPLRAAALLVGIAFAYGVLHAAGPGHGKAVISAYVLANRETVRRGIALSFLSAFVQAMSAIVFVGIMVLVLQQTSIQMRSTEATIETVSWGLVAVVGAFLLYRQIAAYFATSRLKAPDHAHHHDHGHAHTHHDAHNHAHGADCSCGHSHMPAPQDLQGAWSWRRALPLALSVGIRPCSGAILLLIFALSQGMLWAGIVGTFAMAIGTAITVSLLAALAVTSRDWAAKASGPGSVWAERLQTAAGFVGAGLVFVLGTAFFIASLSGPAPF